MLLINEVLVDDLGNKGLIDENTLATLKEHIKENYDFKVLSYLTSNSIFSEEKLLDEVVAFFFSNEFILEDLTKGLDFPNIETFLQKCADRLKLKYYNLDSVDIDYELSSHINIEQLRKLGALPVKETEINIFVAIKKPRDIVVQEKVQRLFQKKLLKVIVADPDQIDKYLHKVEMSAGMSDLISEIKNELQVKSTDNLQELSSILKLIKSIIKSALIARASDIHIEPTKKNCYVRVRIDGALTELFIFTKDIYYPLASRLKLLANLNIAERRKPQDGRFSYDTMGRKLDFRISTLPVSDGESIVLRILDNSAVMLGLNELGMNQVSSKRFHQAIKNPYGIVFITGPTGSGKTTTLYAALNEIKSVEKKIITVEDPIEYRMNIVQQTQVNEKVNHDFASALRSILRQDPDIIMIGEARDQETLQIAIRASLTGHLVFSTLHTNDAVSAITRLTDMGIEPYYISGAIVAIVAQRLVRQLCTSCKEPITLPDTTFEKIKHHINTPSFQFYEKKGCSKCSGTGFLGRVMISEVLDIDEDIQSLIARGADKYDILEQAIKNGFVDMFSDGVQKASQGLTILEEVYRVTK